MRASLECLVLSGFDSWPSIPLARNNFDVPADQLGISGHLWPSRRFFPVSVLCLHIAAALVTSARVTHLEPTQHRDLK